MKVKILVLCSLIALGGCAGKSINEMSYSERNELAKAISKRCADLGYDDKNPKMPECIKAEVEREHYTREANKQRAYNARMALAGSMASYGQGLQAASVPRAPTTCNTTGYSTFVGGTPTSYNTTCY